MLLYPAEQCVRLLSSALLRSLKYWHKIMPSDCSNFVHCYLYQSIQQIHKRQFNSSSQLSGPYNPITPIALGIKTFHGSNMVFSIGLSKLKISNALILFTYRSFSLVLGLGVGGGAICIWVRSMWIHWSNYSSVKKINTVVITKLAPWRLSVFSVIKLQLLHEQSFCFLCRQIRKSNQSRIHISF